MVAWPIGIDSPPPALAAADGDQPTDEVEVVELQVDDLAGADRGLEHEPDDGLVAAVVKRVLGRRASASGRRRWR